MRKRCLVPTAVLTAGLIGAVLRRTELNTAFEKNGLARPGAGITVALALLSAAVVAACAILAVILGRRFTTPEGYKRVFRTDSYLLFAVMVLLGSGVTLCAVGKALFGGELLGLTGVLRGVFLALLALSGLGMTVMAYSAYTQKDTPLLKAGSVLPSVFFCFWMVSIYRLNAGNPVILDYCYSALALGTAAISAYYAAGYAFGRKALTAAVLMSCSAIYLLTVAAADPAPTTLRVVLAAAAVFLTVNTTDLLAHLKPEEKKE